MQPSKKSRSPYCRHQKAPYVYSNILQSLLSAIRAGDESGANRLRRQHDEMLWREKPFTQPR